MNSIFNLENDIFTNSEFDFWRGEKVILRAVREDDVKLRNEETRDSNGFRILNWGVELPKSIEMDKASVNAWVDFNNSESRMMFSIDNFEGEHVGAINLNSFDNKNGTFSAGMRIYRPYRNRGYGQDALRITLRYAFFEMRLQKCNSGCVYGNKASQTMHEKLGFVVEGRIRRAVYMNGQYYDDLRLGLTIEEFIENESAYYEKIKNVATE